VAAHTGASIKYLNGTRLRRALIAGARHVIQNKDHLNKINVFPVADGDTGSNMAGTLGYIVEGIRHKLERHINHMLQSVADLALAGARGCSGTILAQFLHGLARELGGSPRLTTDMFGAGVRLAVAYPYEAVSEPREGTILSVLRDWGESVFHASRTTEDFAELFAQTFHAAQKALERTPNQLPVLAKAGVVDAGAQGFVNLLGGITEFIARGKLRDIDRAVIEAPGDDTVPNEVMEDPRFRYCTQFVMEHSDADISTLKADIGSLGDSLIVAGSPMRAKIHIHSDTPALVLEQVEKHGTVTNQRAEDMKFQFRAAHAPHAPTALVVDSLCDLPRETLDAHLIHMVPVLVFQGKKTYLDKLTVTTDRVFSMLRDSSLPHPTTSQPAPADFKNRFDFLLSHYSGIVSLSVSGNISGTFDSSRAAARMCGSAVEAIDTKTVSIGIGLIARRAAEAVSAGKSREEVVELVRRLIPRVRIHFTVPTLEHLIRSGRLTRAKGLAAKALNLRPIIGIGAKTGGRLEQETVVFGARNGLGKIMEMLRAEIDPKVPVEFAVGHSNGLEDAQWLRDRIGEFFTTARETFICQVTTSLAVHVGEGASGVAYLEPEN
jgi:DegV family protein with EDD domain